VLTIQEDKASPAAAAYGHFGRTDIDLPWEHTDMAEALKKAYPQSNIAAVDYDPGASEVNQLNRIKLMLSTAKKNIGLDG